MIDIPALLRDPAQAAALSVAERQRLTQQMAALILAINAAPQNNERDRILSPEETAELLGMSPSWVYEHATTLLAPCRVKLGKALRFSELGVLKFIEQRKG